MAHFRRVQAATENYLLQVDDCIVKYMTVTPALTTGMLKILILSETLEVY